MEELVNEVIQSQVTALLTRLLPLLLAALVLIKVGLTGWNWATGNTPTTEQTQLYKFLRYLTTGATAWTKDSEQSVSKKPMNGEGMLALADVRVVWQGRGGPAIYINGHNAKNLLTPRQHRRIICRGRQIGSFLDGIAATTKVCTVLSGAKV